MYIGITLVIFGIVSSSFSGTLTKKYIRMNNPEAWMYDATQMRQEWKRVAKEGNVVPKWVSLFSMGGWFVLFVGIFLVVRAAWTG